MKPVTFWPLEKLVLASASSTRPTNSSSKIYPPPVLTHPCLDQPGQSGYGAYLGRVLVILVRENPKFRHRGGFVGARAQFGSVQACGFHAHEDPIG